MGNARETYQLIQPFLFIHEDKLRVGPALCFAEAYLAGKYPILRLLLSEEGTHLPERSGGNKADRHPVHTAGKILFSCACAFDPAELGSIGAWPCFSSKDAAASTVAFLCPSAI